MSGLNLSTNISQLPQRPQRVNMSTIPCLFESEVAGQSGADFVPYRCTKRGRRSVIWLLVDIEIGLSTRNGESWLIVGKSGRGMRCWKSHSDVDMLVLLNKS